MRKVAFEPVSLDRSQCDKDIRLIHVTEQVINQGGTAKIRPCYRCGKGFFIIKEILPNFLYNKILWCARARNKSCAAGVFDRNSYGFSY